MNDLGECVLCRGSGMVSVPNLRSLEQGSWSTQAVLCRCALGRWVGARQGGDGPGGERRGPLMTLDNYETLCPNWRDVLIHHYTQCEIDLRLASGRRTSEADRDWQKLVDRLASTAKGDAA